MKADSLLKSSAAVLAAGAAVGIIFYLWHRNDSTSDSGDAETRSADRDEEEKQEEPDRQAYAKRGYVRIHSAYTEDAGTGKAGDPASL